MATPIRTPHEARRPAGSRDPAGPGGVTPAVPLSAEGAARRSYFLARAAAGRQPLPEQTAAALAEPAESLVPDARRGLTPAQQVDRRVLHVLGTGHPGRFSEAAGRPQDLRRIPGRCEAAAPSE